MVDDESAHNAGSIPHEARLIGKGIAIAPGDVEIGFMQERGNAQASGERMPRQFPLREPVQLTVQSPEQHIRDEL